MGTRIAVCMGAKGGVGTTALAANLAAGLSILGQSVLLVDASPSNPQLNLWFPGVKRQGDLARLLDSSTDMESSLQEPTGYPGLRLAATCLSEDHNQVLLEPDNAERLREIAVRFDVTIIDAGPAAGASPVALEAATERWVATQPDFLCFDMCQEVLPHRRNDLPGFLIPNRVHLAGAPRDLAGGEPSWMTWLTREDVELLKEMGAAAGLDLVAPIRAADDEFLGVLDPKEQGRTLWDAFPVNRPFMRDLLRVTRHLQTVP